MTLRYNLIRLLARYDLFRLWWRIRSYPDRVRERRFMRRAKHVTVRNPEELRNAMSAAREPTVIHIRVGPYPPMTWPRTQPLHRMSPRATIDGGD